MLEIAGSQRRAVPSRREEAGKSFPFRSIQSGRGNGRLLMGKIVGVVVWRVHDHLRRLAVMADERDGNLLALWP